jgi:hypothetical protein
MELYLHAPIRFYRIFLTLRLIASIVLSAHDREYSRQRDTLSLRCDEWEGFT